MAPKVEVVDLSSEDSESFEVSSEDSDHAMTATFKGPRWANDDSYDEFCVYPNRVALSPEQVVLLKNICEEKEPRIPIYVCTIRDTHVAEDGKGKMYFNKEFTQTYLRGYITRSGYDMSVYYGKAKKMEAVKVKIDKAYKCAIMTSKWMHVVDAEDYGEGEILMFWFRRASEHMLKLYVDRIQPGAFGLGTHKHMLLLEAHGLA